MSTQQQATPITDRDSNHGASSKQALKRPYRRPGVSELGSVRELTLAGGSAFGDGPSTRGIE
ncbi:MAG: hypothetical protein FJ096_01430 [Deltaproteobacteria bacterium]|nr:hypothetical protein [Deltaproteobacteria bacterium]